MQAEEIAIIKALVPLAWADGEFADAEKETIEALLDAYAASDAEKVDLRKYAGEKRGIDDLDTEVLTATSRRIVISHGVILSFIDGEQAASELELLQQMGTRFEIPEDELQFLLVSGASRARRFLGLLKD